ncbi:hypothetical protein DERF_015010 [Dermatophagoides farinae]|uniref:Uncharacterized protein n=1 Tax=Dermatophagoides farinae TaxID=6954 RepID=A0A922HNF8_DERFA|nr:hypothetical protein DERF_015010 [Dermatophagoides farinae]
MINSVQNLNGIIKNILDNILMHDTLMIIESIVFKPTQLQQSDPSIKLTDRPTDKPAVTSNQVD